MSPILSKLLILTGALSLKISATPVDTAEIPFSTQSFIETLQNQISSPTSPEANITARSVFSKLPTRALQIEHDYQPVLDFDRDGCYYIADIDSGGNKNPGLQPEYVQYPECLSHACRDRNRLENNNVYSRQHCLGEWCAIMYEYYFERDYYDCDPGVGLGHIHDWENIVVFVQNGVVRQVSVSRHGGYDAQRVSDGKVRLQGKRAKVVYHKDGISTHAFRHAKAEHDATENQFGVWFLGNLVGWGSWPSDSVRDRGMYGWDESEAHPKLTNHKFPEYIRKAAAGKVPAFNNWNGPL